MIRSHSVAEREFSIVKQRILQYLDYKSITNYKFYQETGISNGILSQKNGLSEENIVRFLSVYRDVSPNWLLTGEGEMLKKRQKSEETETDREWKDLYYEQKSLLENQTKMIERLENENKKLAARKEDDAECADVDTVVTA